MTFHNGYWRIFYDGRWYGTYPNRASAQTFIITVVQAHGELPTHVVVREADGSEEVVGEPIQQREQRVGD